MRKTQLVVLGAVTIAVVLSAVGGERRDVSAQEGAFSVCPPPDGLAMSVWLGPDGVAAGTAIATCAEVEVDAALYFDHARQSWLIFIRGGPDSVNTLHALDHLQPTFLRGGPAAPPGAPAQTRQANLRPPGSDLPSDAEAASLVTRHGFEHRQRNAPMNRSVPTSVAIPGYVRNDGGTDDRARALADRVTGNFTGTTDEILQWGAHKWGFDEDFVRALAAIESWWEQSTEGDHGTSAERCAVVAQAAPCYESYGIMQVRPPSHRGTWPDAATSTAFNVDYALMFIRVAYEGYLTWLYDLGFDDYRAGDEWGAAGVWVSGRWYTERAREYIDELRRWYDTKPWSQDWFLGNE